MPALTASPNHGIKLGGFALVAGGQPMPHVDSDGNTYTTDVSSDGTTWGNPEVVISSLISEIADGDIVSQTRTGNREPVLYVRISSDTHAGLVAGDTALGAVVGPSGELVWQPPDPAAPPTVIDVVWSKMDHQWDDWDSVNHRRVWVVNMAALPWPRSADLVVTPAVATASTTVVDNGSSPTNWSSHNGTVASTAGAIVSTYVGNTLVGGATLYGTSLTLAIPGGTSTTTQKYIAIDWKSSVPVYIACRINASLNLAEIKREPLAAGYSRSWFRTDDNSVTSIHFGTVHAPAAGSQTLSIDQVQKSETLPATGTVRQITRSVDPGGNVPAEGSIMVEHATAGLWQTVVFSHPATGGYSPPLRPWLFSSDAVAPGSGVSGYFNAIDGNCIFHVPVGSVPQGEVQLWARLNKGSAGVVNVAWAAVSAMGATSVGPQQQGQTACTFPGNGYYFFPLASLTLPTTPIGPAGFVGIAIQAAGSTVILDDAYLFATDRGRLTVVDCGNGTPAAGTISNRLRIDAPSLEKPFGGIMVGTAADWSDAYGPPSANVLCDQTGHRFDPDGSVVYVITAGPTTESSVSFEHYPRWRAEAGT